MNKRKFLSLLAVLLLAVTFTSCLDDDDDNTLMLRGHFTIEGTYPNYTLYHRGGYVVRLDPQSVNEATNGKGFVSPRGYFDIYYTQANVTQDVQGNITITNAKLGSGSYVNVYDIMDEPTAESRNLNAPDSVFSVSSLTDLWVHRGYMNVVVEAPYSIVSSNGVYPTLNMSYSPESIGENALTLTLLYNRHTAKDVQTASGSFVAAYPVSTLLRMVPGNDSIFVTLNMEGAASKTIKVGR